MSFRKALTRGRTARAGRETSHPWPPVFSCAALSQNTSLKKGCFGGLCVYQAGSTSMGNCHRMTYGLRKLTNVFWKTVVAVFLTLVVTSPAVAQLGCTQDAVIMMQRAVGVTAAASDGNWESQDEQKSAPTNKLIHCPFAHCPSAVAASWPDGDKAPLAQPTNSYFRVVTPALLAAPRDGPERPPRA